MKRAVLTIYVSKTQSASMAAHVDRKESRPEAYRGNNNQS
jgi:hypothetical protein